MIWLDLKAAFLEMSGLSHDLSHIYFAVVIQLGLAVVLRRSVKDFRLVVAVLVFELFNEYMDIVNIGGFENMTEQLWRGVAWDVVHTLSIPLLLWAVSNFAPGLLGAKAATKDNAISSGENAGADESHT